MTGPVLHDDDCALVNAVNGQPTACSCTASLGLGTDRSAVPAGPVQDVDEDRKAAQFAVFHDIDLALEGVRALLRLAGEDPNRPGLLDTPARYLRAWQEMTQRPGDPDKLLAVIFDDAGPVDQMVAVGPVAFTSLCEHHLLPFTGHAWVAYIPQAGVVGLSKIPRLLEHYARRPQVQERLTEQVAQAIVDRVPCQGVGVLLRAVHSCASMRGVRAEAPMTTSSLHGAFRDDERTRQEFLALARP